MLKRNLVNYFFMGLLLASCSGGGTGTLSTAASNNNNANEEEEEVVETEDSSATAEVGFLSGTAAIGAPLGLANVTIKGTGVCNTTPIKGLTNSQGVFHVDVSACTEPYYVKVSSALGELAILAPKAGAVANVTPLTQLISQRAAQGKNLEAALASVNSTALIASLAAEETVIKNVLNEYSKAVGAGDLSGINLMSGSFVANGDGVDKLLDLVKIEDSSGDNINIVVGSNSSIAIDVLAAANSLPKIDATDASTYASEVSGKADKLTMLRTLMSDITNLFKKDEITEADLKQYFAADFLHKGMDFEEHYEDLEEDHDNLIFKNVVILNDDINDFWIAIQIFTLENNKLVLDTVWTSKVDLANKKLLGDRMSFAIYSGYIKHKVINASNVVTDDDTYRAIEFGNLSTMNGETITLKEFNDVEISSGGIVAFSQTPTRNIDNLSSEFSKLLPGEANTGITKVKYSVGAGADQITYVNIVHENDIAASNFVDLSFPEFNTSSSVANNCKYSKDDLASFTIEDFAPSSKNYELERFEMFFYNYNSPEVNPANQNNYPGFSAFDWENLTTTNLQFNFTDYKTKNPSLDYLKVGKFEIARYVPGEVIYRTIYTCADAD